MFILKLNHKMIQGTYKINSLSLKRFFFLSLLFFFDQGNGGRKGEKHQCLVASGTSLTGDLAHNPGMCLDWESNQRPFGAQAAVNPLSNITRVDNIFLFCYLLKNFSTSTITW